MERIRSEEEITLTDIYITRYSDNISWGIPYKKPPKSIHRYSGKQILEACNEKGVFDLISQFNPMHRFRGEVKYLIYMDDVSEVAPRSEKTIFKFEEFLKVGKKTTLTKKVVERF